MCNHFREVAKVMYGQSLRESRSNAANERPSCVGDEPPPVSPECLVPWWDSPE